MAAGTVGHLLNGALDLLTPFAPNALVDRYRHRGSFIEPTLRALAGRATLDAAPAVHAVVLGDGLLTDFTPLPVPMAVDVLRLVVDEAVARAGFERAGRGRNSIPPVVTACRG